MVSRVLVAGGGASGLLVAVNILRKNDQIEVVMVEPSKKLGRGIAYSTSDRDHLLNVPAGRMSGLVEDPLSLCRWAGVTENHFVSRQQYGDYLESLLKQELSRGAENRFTHLRDLVVDLDATNSGFHVALASGQTVDVDQVVLALGNSEPISPDFLTGLPAAPRVIRDVWGEGIKASYDQVAVIGTGLTFYDVSLSILRDRPTATIHGISRNGLLPSPHLRERAPALPVPPEVRLSSKSIREYLIAAGDKWREAQDGIRHDLQEIWASFPEAEKKVFVTEHFRWWNSLRHRSAPEIDDRIKDEIRRGRILVHQGEVVSVQSVGSEFELKLANGELIRVEQVINCSGNQFVATHPLIEILVKKDLAQRGPLGYGIACEPKTLAIKDSSGKAHKNLYGIGPILVGELLETTAIPEIRVEANLVATELLQT